MATKLNELDCLGQKTNAGIFRYVDGKRYGDLQWTPASQVQALVDARSPFSASAAKREG